MYNMLKDLSKKDLIAIIKQQDEMIVELRNEPKPEVKESVSVRDAQIAQYVASNQGMDINQLTELLDDNRTMRLDLMSKFNTPEEEGILRQLSWQKEAIEQLIDLARVPY